jgi:ABC-type multidrug transport system fused ATPase/permease subunit
VNGLTELSLLSITFLPLYARFVVFELMYRKPRFKDPTLTSSLQQETRASTAETPSEAEALLPQHPERHSLAINLPIGGMTAVSETSRRRGLGLEPETCSGEIEFQDVDMYYPARPQRKILNKLSLRVPAGKVAALVGQSGGGKSRCAWLRRFVSSILPCALLFSYHGAPCTYFFNLVLFLFCSICTSRRLGKYCLTVMK